MRIALGVEYDGSAFCGWQTQPGGCGVQDHLQAALSQLADSPIEITAAGRTDAGVHATAQVVHFDTEAVRDANSWVRGTNANLDPSARVVWASEVPSDFHARFSARQRSYRYLLLNESVAPAVMLKRAGWYHRPLDVEAMQRAASMLLGEHDFSAFRDAQCQAKSPIRNLTEAHVLRNSNLVTFGFTANAFLHHMIRNVVGSLVYVGAGKQPVEWIDELMAARDRTKSAPTFAPDGLYLTNVQYDPQFALPAFRSQPLLGSPSPSGTSKHDGVGAEGRGESQ